VKTPQTGRLITQFISDLRKTSRLARHRNCIVLSGSLKWCDALSKEIVEHPQPGLSVDTESQQQDTIRISANHPADASGKIKTIHHDFARKYLGQEFDIVIFDCHQNFSADALGIIGGTIRAGGLLLLMVPDLSIWGESVSTPSPYTKRFKRILTSDPHTICIGQDQPLPDLSVAKNPDPASVSFLDQDIAVQAVEKVVTGQRKRPAVLISDRGRGKSAALGLAAQSLLLQSTNKNKIKIAVTGFNRQSVETVFQHAGLDDTSSSLKFYPAEKLALKKRKCDLLLVDEAASIPMHLLEHILQNYSRIAFSSTVHGYEGTGRGFVLSFSKLLNQYTRGWKTTRLEAPIRWSVDDPLESLLFKLLLLDAEISPLEQTASPSDFSSQISKAELINPESLIQNNLLLQDVFGLLTQAHYRTRPSDLQNLLDNPANRLLRISCHNQTTAIIHVVMEGSLENDVAISVWKNQRRPKGHLIPEILSAQLGLCEASSLRTARIVRIVTHPELRRRGLGSMALEAVEQILTKEIDMLGTTFSLSADTLSFWLSNRFQPVRIGIAKSSNTGHHSCTLLKSLSDDAAHIQHEAARQLSTNIGIALSRDLNTLDAEIAIAIIRSVNGHKQSPRDYLQTLHQRQYDDLICLAYFGRNPDGMISVLCNFVRIILSFKDNGLDQEMETLLVQRVLQNREWGKCVALSQSSARPQDRTQGKTQGMVQLRNIIRSSLEKFDSERAIERLAHYDST